MTEPVKIGLIGAGGVTKFAHIPAYKKLGSKAKIVAVCDQNLDAARSLSESYSIPSYFGDSGQMLAEAKLDMIDVCTPPKTHYQITTEAISKGLNVLLEKPMALTNEECASIVSATKEKGVKLTVVHNNLFVPVFRRALEYVKGGGLGDLVSVNVSLSEPRTGMISAKNHWVHTLPGGVLMETGPHTVYMVQALLGSPEDVSIIAHSNLKLAWAPYDEFRIFFSYPRCLAQMSLSYSGSRWGARTLISGTKGSLELDLSAGWLIKQPGRSQKKFDYFSENWAAAYRIAAGVSGSGVRSMLRMNRYGHDVIIERFIDSIRENEPVPVAPEEAAETVQLINLIIGKLGKEGDGK